MHSSLTHTIKHTTELIILYSYDAEQLASAAVQKMDRFPVADMDTSAVDVTDAKAPAGTGFAVTGESAPVFPDPTKDAIAVGEDEYSALDDILFEDDVDVDDEDDGIYSIGGAGGEDGSGDEDSAEDDTEFPFLSDTVLGLSPETRLSAPLPQSSRGRTGRRRGESTVRADPATGSLDIDLDELLDQLSGAKPAVGVRSLQNKFKGSGQRPGLGRNGQESRGEGVAGADRDEEVDDGDEGDYDMNEFFDEIENADEADENFDGVEVDDLVGS